jgi:hypothetical protein
MKTQEKNEKATEHVAIKPSVHKRIFNLSFRLNLTHGEVVEEAVNLLAKEKGLDFEEDNEDLNV